MFTTGGFGTRSNINWGGIGSAVGGTVEDLARRAAAAGADAATDYVGTALGGGSEGWVSHYRNEQKGRVCPYSPDPIIAIRAVMNAPESEIQTLIRRLAAPNKGLAPQSREELARRDTAQLWITAAMGGQDCQAKSDPEFPRWLREFCQKYGSELGDGGTTTTGNAPGSYDPSSSGGVQGGLLGGPNVVPTSGGGAGESIDDIVRNTKKTLEEALRSGLDQFARTIGGASDAAEKARREAEEQARQSANVPGSVAALGIDGSTLLLLGIAGVAAVVLMKD